MLFYKRGFTLIELLVVIGIIAVLSGVVIIAINPARQFAQARDTQRTSSVRAILDAIGQRMADNQGVFEIGCSAGVIPTSTQVYIASSSYHIAPCIIPTYISTLPIDPSDANARFINVNDYDTGFTIQRSSSTNRVTVFAPSAELNPISITR